MRMRSPPQVKREEAGSMVDRGHLIAVAARVTVMDPVDLDRVFVANLRPSVHGWPSSVPSPQRH